MNNLEMKYTNYMRYMNENLSEDDLFNYFMSNLRKSIADWSYYVNWNKIENNVEDIELQLNQLNYLTRKSNQDNIKDSAKKLFTQYPEVIGILPIVFASRGRKFSILDSDTLEVKKYNFYKKTNYSTEEIDEVIYFLDNIGFFEMIRKKNITNFIDYVFGVEVGLDTNARKNRTGTSMETIIEKYINEICIKNDWEYIAQATSKSIYSAWNIHVPDDRARRQYDFAVYNPYRNKVLIVEVNYYRGGGSKLKSVSGELSELNEFLKQENISFCWITDGLGWKTARKPLNEAFDKIWYLFNIDMVKKGHLEYLIDNL